jgi:cytoskeletal protein CcmA (bactofilin family)/ribosomal protein S27E
MASKAQTISVTCPKCGHVQSEPKSGYSTVCRSCRSHFRLEDSNKPAAGPEKPAIETVQVACFQCGAELSVPTAAESTMCKKCSSHVDLRDYEITSTVSKNFRTHGKLVVGEKGYVLNTDSHVGDAVIKGRFIGKIIAVRSLEIHSSANIKGTFSAGRLIVPAGNHLRWPETLKIGGAEIGGELAATIHCTGTVHLKSSARLFGDVEAANFIVESGAVFVGAVKIGVKSVEQVGPAQQTGSGVATPKPAPKPRTRKKAAGEERGFQSAST